MESGMFLLYYAGYQRIIEGSLQEPYMALQKRVPRRTLYKGFYIPSLKVSAERWVEEPLKVLLTTFISESVYYITSIAYMTSRL